MNKSYNKTFNEIIKQFIEQNDNFNNKSKDFINLEKSINIIVKTIKNITTVEYDRDFYRKFYETYNLIKNSSKVTPIMHRQFIQQLEELFTSINDIKVKEILNMIKTCEEQLDNLENTTNILNIKKWFSGFCKNICLCMTKLFSFSKELTSVAAEDFIIIHIIQLSVYLQLILKLFMKESTNQILIMESRRFIIKRFRYNFSELRDILINNTDDIDKNSNFIFWIDNALDLIGIIEPKTLEIDVNKARPAIEEVLCHAMSTAQICTSDDSKAIKASIQSVLHEFNQLETESKKLKPDFSLINLYIDVVSDKLCVLERRVNTAVLKISLKAFSEYFEPLRSLQSTCDAVDVSILSRSESDLDTLITDFDLHVDQIMQIGLFAIACSTDKKILSKMRSCLSNLEALESELVPALTTLYMEPSKVACLHVNLFVDHWKDQVASLRDAIFFIIDPIAFGQVVREDYKTILDTLEELSNANKVITNSHLGKTTKNIEIFISVIKASVPDLKLSDNSNVLKHLKNLEDVHHEVCSAANILLKDPSLKNNDRILKRFLVLLTMIDRIMNILSKNTEQNISSKISKENSIKSEKLDVNVTNIVERGQILLKDRSMLFRTPKTAKKKITFVPITPRNFGMTPKTAKYSESRKKAISFAKKVISMNIDETNSNESLDLQITNILEDLTCLVDTLP